MKSALCLIADVLQRGADFRFVPLADIGPRALAIEPLVQNVAGLNPRSAHFGEQEHSFHGEQKMHAVLSVLFGTVLVGLVYGLSFFPSATLGQNEEAEETVSRAHQEGANPDAENPEAQSRALRRWVGRESDAS